MWTNIIMIASAMILNLFTISYRIKKGKEIESECWHRTSKLTSAYSTLYLHNMYQYQSMFLFFLNNFFCCCHHHSNISGTWLLFIYLFVVLLMSWARIEWLYSRFSQLSWATLSYFCLKFTNLQLFIYFLLNGWDSRLTQRSHPCWFRSGLESSSS